MKIYPRVSNAIDIELENGDIIEIHEHDNTLSFSSLPDYIKVTTHNIKTLEYDTVGAYYQVSLKLTGKPD